MRPTTPAPDTAALRRPARRRPARAAGPAVLGTLALALTSCTDAPSSPQSTEDLLVTFAAEQRPEDALPTVAGQPDDRRSDELAGETSRFLGASDHAKFWAVQNDDGAICLVIGLQDTSTARTCLAPADFSRRGVWLGHSGPEERVLAFLVPDAMEVEEVPEGMTAVTPWLVAGESTGDAETVRFTVPDDIDSSLAPIEMPLD